VQPRLHLTPLRHKAEFLLFKKKKDRQAQVFFVFGRMKLCDGSTTQKKRQHVMSFLIFFCLFFGVPASARSSHLATKKIWKGNLSVLLLSVKFCFTLPKQNDPNNKSSEVSGTHRKEDSSRDCKYSLPHVLIEEEDVDQRVACPCTCQ
jgi:hypothetical protein